MVRVALACVAFLVAAVGHGASGSEQAATSRVVVTRPSATARRNAATTTTPTMKPTAPASVNGPVAPPAPDDRTELFALAGTVPLFDPAQRVIRVGFHQASDVRDRMLTIARTAIAPVVMASRGRGTAARTAADIVVEPQELIYAPVSGIVKRAGNYHLYCKYPDSFAVISPAGHPELEVKMLHITGLHVRPGDRVTQGKTVIASHATKFPFVSEVDVFTHQHLPHVHIEVTPLAIPSAVPQPGKGLAFGCR